MSIPSSIFINNSIVHDGYVNPEAFDSNHKGKHGYWICSQCGITTPSGRKLVHLRPDCSIGFRNKNMIYIFGQNDNGFYSPFSKEKLAEMKQNVRKNSDDGDFKKTKNFLFKNRRFMPHTLG